MPFTADVALVVDARAEAGESPWWSAREHVLYWVDIHGCKVHRYDPTSDVDDVLVTPDLVAFCATHTNGGLIVALRDRVCHVDFAEAAFRTLSVMRLPDGVRLNDGTIDPAGRLWIGTMDSRGDAAANAALYRIDVDGRCEMMLDGFRTVNGLAFAPDGSTLYVSDSHPAVRTIWALDYDVRRGIANARRVFVATHRLPGRPDGGAVDAEGCYWMAAVDGGCLMRFGADGELLSTWAMPVEKPSKAAFGGAGLSTLFVTSLRRNLSRPIDAQPHAGGLFALQTGIRGIALPDCAIATLISAAG